MEAEALTVEAGELEEDLKIMYMRVVQYVWPGTIPTKEGYLLWKARLPKKMLRAYYPRMHGEAGIPLANCSDELVQKLYTFE